MDDKEVALPQHMLPRGTMGKITYSLMNRMHSGIYKNVADVLSPRPDDDLLDVACGNGHFLKKYASQARSVAGLDLSEVGIQMASKKHAARVAAGTGEFVRGDAAELPWQEGRFTAVTSMGSAVAFPRAFEALKEMHRVLRPGGRAVVSLEWNAEDGEDHSKQQAKYGFEVWTEEQVRTLMKEAGFSDVTITYRAAMGMPKIMMVQALK